MPALKTPPASAKPSGLGTIGAIIGGVASVLFILWLLRGDNSFLTYLLDVDVYRLGAKEFLGGGNLYDQSFHTRLIDLPFTYPPFGALFFAPLALLPQTAVQVIIIALSALCLWASVAAVLSHYGQARPWVKALWVVPFALVSEPVRATFEFGQINLVLMALVIADVTGVFRRLPRGVLVGIAAAIKLTPAYYGLYYLARRDWKGVAGVIGGFLGATFVAFLIHPHTTIQYFTAVLFDNGRIGNLEYAMNVSLSGLNARINADSRLIWLVATVIVTVLVYFSARAAHKAGQDFLAFIVVALGCLCVSPVSWSHHWVWLVPAAIALYFTRHYVLAAWAILMTYFLDFHALLPRDHQVEMSWNWFEQLLGLHYVLYALVVIVVVIVRPVGAGRRRR